jgi:radical SAM-linked protein
MDSLPEVARKQQILRDLARGHKAVKLKVHEANASVLEGIFARGDRRLADVLERAWKKGARFDSWDDQLRLQVWEEAFAHFDVDRACYLGTIPLTARLPWSHIDVGLEDGFLAGEYRKALQNRLSPPCGKVAGAFVHHDNLEDARADDRRLVCYDCGVACDMTQMRDERITFLAKLGAEKRSLPIARATPEAAEEPARATPRSNAKGGFRYRFRYEKTGATALLGHLDVTRELPRVLRRLGISMVYTNGFHPKPDMSFGPALSLGVMSLDEYADLRLAADLDPDDLARLVQDMTRSSPGGLVFRGAIKLRPKDPGVTRVIAGARYAIAFARHSIQVNGHPAELLLAERCAAAMSAASIPFRRQIDGVGKMLDVRTYLLRAEVAGADAHVALARAGLVGELVAIDVDCAIPGSGAVKAAEVAAVIAGDGTTAPPHRAVRVELFGLDDSGRFSPLDLGRGTPPGPAMTPAPEAATATADAE